MMAKRGTWAFTALILIAGCSEPYVFADIPPVQPSPSAFPGQRETITGVVEMSDNGCVTLDLGERGLRWIIWPGPEKVGTSDDGDLYLGDHPITDGDVLTGTGTLADAAVLPGWEDDDKGAYFGLLGRFCDADDLGIVVFDEVTVTTG